MKRYVCTVSDRRGHKGDCMRKDKNGRYVEYSDAVRMLEHVRRECDSRLAKANREQAELVRALEFMVANIAQPVALETRDGFSAAMDALSKAKVGAA